MTFDLRKAEAYIQKLKKQLHESPDKMDSYERRLLTKHNEAKKKSEGIDNDVRNLRQQIVQAQARIGSLEMQYHDCEGKASAYVEALIARKFEDELDDIPLPVKAKTNGRSAALPKGKKAKKKRSRRSKANSKSASATA